MNSDPERTLAVSTPMSTPDVLKVAEVMAKSGFFKDAKDVAKAAVKIMAGQELGIGPVASMKGLYVTDKGNIELHANLQAALVRRFGRYDYEVKELSDEVCTLHFFRTDEKRTLLGISSFSVADAKRAGVGQAGQYNNFQKYPRNFLFARAMSNGVRWYCPDSTSGIPVYSPGETSEGIIIEGEITETEAGEKVNTETGEVVDPEPASIPHMIPTLKKWTMEKGIPWPAFVNSLKKHHPDTISEEEAIDLLTEEEIKPLLVGFKARHPEYFVTKSPAQTGEHPAKAPKTANPAPQVPNPPSDPQQAAESQPYQAGDAERALFPPPDEEAKQARLRYEHLVKTARAFGFPLEAGKGPSLRRLMDECWPDRGDTDIWRIPVEVFDRVDTRLMEIEEGRKPKG